MLLLYHLFLGGCFLLDDHHKGKYLSFLSPFGFFRPHPRIRLGTPSKGHPSPPKRTWSAIPRYPYRLHTSLQQGYSPVGRRHFPSIGSHLALRRFGFYTVIPTDYPLNLTPTIAALMPFSQHNYNKPNRGKYLRSVGTTLSLPTHKFKLSTGRINLLQPDHQRKTPQYLGGAVLG